MNCAHLVPLPPASTESRLSAIQSVATTKACSQIISLCSRAGWLAEPWPAIELLLCRWYRTIALCHKAMRPQRDQRPEQPRPGQGGFSAPHRVENRTAANTHMLCVTKGKHSSHARCSTSNLSAPPPPPSAPGRGGPCKHYRLSPPAPNLSRALSCLCGAREPHESLETHHMLTTPRETHWLSRLYTCGTSVAHATQDRSHDMSHERHTLASTPDASTARGTRVPACVPREERDTAHSETATHRPHDAITT
jgi:hypothetical protein